MNYLCEKVFVFGEILFDVFDGEEKLGGAPFNVAYNLLMQGHSPFMVSRVGSDRLGSAILSFMESSGLSTEYVDTDTEHGTGRVDVEVRDGEPSYHIRKDQAYDHIQTAGAQTENSFIYYGTLAVRNSTSRETLLNMTKNAFCGRFYDVNLRDGNWDVETVRLLAERADYLKLNIEELQTITRELGMGFDGYHDACLAVIEKFDLREIYVTFGAEGAACVGRGFHYSSDRFPVHSLRDTVGAGDAFSSVMINSILRGTNRSTALNRAAFYASAVCSLRGALTEDRDFYKNLLKEMSNVR